MDIHDSMTHFKLHMFRHMQSKNVNDSVGIRSFGSDVILYYFYAGTSKPGFSINK